MEIGAIMNTDERLKKIEEEEKSVWYDIIYRWDNMTALSPAPAFTKEYALKRIQELEAEKKKS